MELKEIKENLYRLNDENSLQKTKTGWRIIKPIKKDIYQPFKSGNINWKNFLIGGTWINVFIVVFVLLAIWSYSNDIEQCKELIENPPECIGYTFKDSELPNITLNLEGGIDETPSLVYPKNYD